MIRNGYVALIITSFFYSCIHVINFTCNNTHEKMFVYIYILFLFIYQICRKCVYKRVNIDSRCGIF